MWNLWENMVIGDQTWMHNMILETKVDSMMWKHPTSLTTTKRKIKWSVVSKEVDSICLLGCKSCVACVPYIVCSDN